MVKRLTIILDETTHRKLKKKSVEMDKGMSEIVREMIQTFVG